MMKVKEPLAAYSHKKKYLTCQDYLKLPDDGNRYELINGELIMAPAPDTFHQIVSWNIELELGNFVKKNRAGIVFHAPSDVVLSEDTVVQPDIFFVARESKNIIADANIISAPDLIIEILSSRTAGYDLLEKKELYAASGVKEYWIVDPKKKTIENYLNNNGKFVLLQRLAEEGTIHSHILVGWEIAWQQVFEF